MFKSLAPVNRERHAGKKIKQIEGFDFARDFHLASLMVHEFVRASALYPVVFLEDKERDQFRPVALLGLDAGENLFVNDEGKWEGSYIPAIIRRYPFALASTGEEGQFTVCIDEGSPLVNDEDGVALFDENGEPAEALENVKRYLGELQQMDALTNACCKFLEEHNLFTPLNMRVRQAEQIRNISGCYVVNEERLHNLSDELFLEMRRRRYLQPIYAHLCSLGQIERLMLFKQQMAETKEPEEPKKGASGRRKAS